MAAISASREIFPVKLKKIVPVTGPVVAQKLGKGIAILFQNHGTRRGWVVSSTPRPYFTPGKDPLPIVQEAGWASEPVWMGRKSRPTGIRSPDRSARSQSLYRLSYLAHTNWKKRWMKKTCIKANIIREISKMNEMDEACDMYGDRRGS